MQYEVTPLRVTQADEDAIVMVGPPIAVDPVDAQRGDRVDMLPKIGHPPDDGAHGNRETRRMPLWNVESSRERPARGVIWIAMLALFAGGMVYGAVKGEDRPCGNAQPLKSRPGMLGGTEYLCPDGRTVSG